MAKINLQEDWSDFDNRKLRYEDRFFFLVYPKMGNRLFGQ